MARRKNPVLVTVVVVVAVLVIYAIVGFLVVPPIARNRITKQASAALHRQVTLDRVTFNPFTFAGSLRTLQVAGSDGGTLATWREARANFNPLISLFRWRWSFGDVVLISPRVHLAVDEQGRLNVADIFAQPAAAKRQGPPSLAVGRFDVEDAQLDFVDRSRQPAFTTAIEPLSFTLTDFSTAPDGKGSYRLSGKTTRGESFTWVGTLQVAPFSSHGHFSFQDVALAAYGPFLDSLMHGKVQSGRAAIASDYTLAFGAKRQATLAGFTLDLNQLALALPDRDQPALELTHGEAGAPRIDLLARSAEVDHVTFDGLSVKAVRQPDGSLDLASLFASNQDPQRSSAPTKSPAPKPDIKIGELNITNGRAVFIDRTTPEPAELHVDAITLTAQDASSHLDEPVKTTLDLRWQDGPGTLHAAGTVQPLPFQMKLDVKGTNLALAALGPYLQSVAGATVSDGRLQCDGQIEGRTHADAPAQFAWKGTVTIDDLATRDAHFHQALASWTQLQTGSAEISTAPLGLHFHQVALRGPKVHLLRGPDGTFNMATAFGTANGENRQGSTTSAKQSFSDTRPSTPRSSGARANGPLDLTVDDLAVSAGTVTYHDQSITPEVETKITDVNGSLKDLSPVAGHTTQVHLAGTLAQSTPVRLDGTINLVAARVPRPSKLTLDLHNLRLQLLEPYAVHFLGYRIKQGSAQANLEYQLTQSRLHGKNHFVLNNLDLGAQVQGPDAINVPLPFALAVLRDRQGKIELTLPVNGDLGSPEFSFAGAIEGAFRNLVLRAATAPFSLLASLFGADEGQLQHLDFPGGRAELDDQDKTSVGTLGKILDDRPGLALTIHWAPNRQVDESALRDQRLDQLIKQEKSRLASASGNEGQGTQQTRSSAPADRNDDTAIRALFARRFPDQVPAEPAGVSPNPPESDQAKDTKPDSKSGGKSLGEAIWDWLFGGEKKSKQTSRSGTAPAPPSSGATSANATQPTAPDLDTMRKRLRQSIQVTDDDIAQLAKSRAEHVRQQLIVDGIAADRIDVAANPGAPQGAEPATDKGRVYFSLHAAGSSAGVDSSSGGNKS